MKSFKQILAEAIEDLPKGKWDGNKKTVIYNGYIIVVTRNIKSGSFYKGTKTQSHLTWVAKTPSGEMKEGRGDIEDAWKALGVK